MKRLKILIDYKDTKLKKLVKKDEVIDVSEERFKEMEKATKYKRLNLYEVIEDVKKEEGENLL